MFRAHHDDICLLKLRIVLSDFLVFSLIGLVRKIKFRGIMQVPRPRRNLVSRLDRTPPTEQRVISLSIA